MTYVGFVCGGVFALGLGAAVLAGSGSASADSTGSGSVKPAHAHSTGSSARVTSRLAAKPKVARSVVKSARPAATVPSSASVAWDDLPPSYYVNSSYSRVFLDGSQNIEPTSISPNHGEATPDDAEIYVLHQDSAGAYVGYTRLYINQNANVPLTGGWRIAAFDSGSFPGDLALTEISAGPPRREPNSLSEYDRESRSSMLGFIPVVGQVVGVLNLVHDGIELRNAQQRGDVDDIADEKADLKTDLINQVLGGQQLVVAIGIVTLPVTVPTVAAVFVLYLWAVNQCVTNPDSGACGVIS